MNTDTTTSLGLDRNELQKFFALPTDLALQQAAPFLANLVKDPAFVEFEILPLLQDASGIEEDWYVARSYEGKDHSFSLQVFVWPPSTETKIHDHSSWGVYCCAVGSVLEERYERVDDGSRPDHARLRKIWQLSWSSEDGASSVLPHDGGIHRVRNPGNETAIRGP
jgi:predicted metal-dependent enzyme (double-stranded beta helix superfamily)